MSFSHIKSKIHCGVRADFLGFVNLQCNIS